MHEKCSSELFLLMIHLYYWKSQEKGARSLQCNGFHVCCCDLHWDTKWCLSAAYNSSWENSLLQRESCGNVFSFAICSCTGKPLPSFNAIYEWQTLTLHRHRHRTWHNADMGTLKYCQKFWLKYSEYVALLSLIWVSIVQKIFLILK